MGSRLRNEISSAQSALSVHHRLQTNFKDETSSRDPAATAGLDSGWCMQWGCRAGEHNLWYLSAQLRPVYLWDVCQCFTSWKSVSQPLLMRVTLYDKHRHKRLLFLDPHKVVREPTFQLWFAPPTTNCLTPQKSQGLTPLTDKTSEYRLFAR